MMKDPVCGMTVDEKTAAWRSDYAGQNYVFCSPGCKKDFDRQPATYAKAVQTPRPLSKG
jgi:YHS domain-containing protein